MDMERVEPSFGMPLRVVTETLAMVRLHRPGAEEELWRIVHSWVRRLAEALLAHDGQRRWLAADDLVQEAFLRLRPAYLRQAGLCRRDLRSLLLRVMRQVLIDESRRRRPVALDEPEHLAANTAREAWMRDLGECLERLARSHSVERQIVDLHVFEGWTFAAIGAEFGGSASWARKHFHAALAVLREDVAHDGPAPAPLTGCCTRSRC